VVSKVKQTLSIKIQNYDPGLTIRGKKKKTPTDWKVF
jgi:hypothetical protein